MVRIACKLVRNQIQITYVYFKIVFSISFGKRSPASIPCCETTSHRRHLRSIIYHFFPLFLSSSYLILVAFNFRKRQISKWYQNHLFSVSPQGLWGFKLRPLSCQFATPNWIKFSFTAANHFFGFLLQRFFRLIKIFKSFWLKSSDPKNCFNTSYNTS